MPSQTSPLIERCDQTVKACSAGKGVDIRIVRMLCGAGESCSQSYGAAKREQSGLPAEPVGKMSPCWLVSPRIGLREHPLQIVWGPTSRNLCSVLVPQKRIYCCQRNDKIELNVTNLSVNLQISHFCCYKWGDLELGQSQALFQSPSFFWSPQFPLGPPPWWQWLSISRTGPIGSLFQSSQILKRFWHSAEGTKQLGVCYLSPILKRSNT